MAEPRQATSLLGQSESEVTQSCPTLCHPVDCVAHQAPPSMGVSRQEYWSGLPLPSPGESSRPRDRTQVSRIAGCQGPAPADPGYSKERRRRRGSGNNCLIKR